MILCIIYYYIITNYQVCDSNNARGLRVVRIKTARVIPICMHNVLVNTPVISLLRYNGTFIIIYYTLHSPTTVQMVLCFQQRFNDSVII